MRSYRSMIRSESVGLSRMSNLRCSRFSSSARSIHRVLKKCEGCLGLQLNQSFDPSTEHRAAIWSTKDSGNSAASSA